jgi:outer membrane protein OmpA-like peptidoglycan-associated protein
MEKKYVVVPIILILIVLVWIGSCGTFAATTPDKSNREVPTKFGLSGLYTLLGTETPAPWEFSIGVYVDYSRLDLPEDPRKPELTEVRLGAALGLIPRFQIGVSVPALDLFLPTTNGIPEFSESGIGDITVSGKYRILNETGGIPAIALYGLVSFPNGDEKIGLGSGSTDYTLGGILTKHVGPLSLYGNVGFFISGYKAGDPNPLLRSLQDSLVYGAGLDFSLVGGNKVNLFAEATFLHEFGSEEEDQVVNLLGIPVEDKVDNPGQLNVGIHLGLSESFVLTGGGGFKLVNENAVPEAPNWRVFGGLTYSFMRKPDTRIAQVPPPTPAPPPTQVIPVEPPLVNRCPEITAVTLSASEILGNERIKISAKATDADNNPLTYQWTATGGEIVGSGGEVIWTAPDCRTIGGPSATYTLTVTVSDAQCPVTQSRTIVVRCERILEGKLPFDKGSARLNNLAKAALDNIAIVLKKFPDQDILIEGHTDAAGSETANKQMGLRRAESVRNYLITRHGIEPRRIRIESLGSTRAIASNDTEEGRRQNRRVEIYRLIK